MRAWQRPWVWHFPEVPCFPTSPDLIEYAHNAGKLAVKLAQMPEMFYTSEAISSDKELGRTIAFITDGRFSGASAGPVIGHCSPEAQAGSPIALVEEGDLIQLDVKEHILAIVGVKGERKTPEEMDAILAERKQN